jgi:hypothetical protein
MDLTAAKTKVGRREVDEDDQKKKCSRAKKKLCCSCASNMMIDMRRARDPAREIETLLAVISQLASST